ncbi:thiol reductant ABC exporter subunit CydD [Vibrio sp. HA2012]|uniref:heme ABC transporter permease/ATP-binding protein CydD n=1 Tax=Vibrio sp. HA2012 TaxID=1971595 RepID=UPI000C2BA7DC|nr:cysteine/glutathione ABC transporter permease/ATP-binding protein CydD [Vibrio sp. HA2012]PJC87777.1 thiol reductant ABC exporter subunit CydD [Vibrio sp. HA2012]
MDKIRQKQLNKWLTQQSQLARRWLIANITLGVMSSLLLLGQAALLADILHQLIIEQNDKMALIPHFIGLAATVLSRSVCSWGREVTGFRCGEQVRIYIRSLILDKLRTLGPAYIKGKPAGVWATLLLEQVEEMQDFFSRYLPQMTLAGAVPLLILLVVFPVNWAAGLIFLLTAPLIPIFMAFVGIKAAEANQKNFKALQRLSGHFYDRLQSMTTIRLFNRADAETEVLRGASEIFRLRTMDVLKVAFLSSAVLEFFTSISIALTAVYFGFSYIGELDFGHYSTPVSLFSGLFILILAPEFYQPLRDLGTFYHAKAQAVGAAESIVQFLETDVSAMQGGDQSLPNPASIQIEADKLIVLTPEGKTLIGPVSFTLNPGKTSALVGPSGAGKTTLLNALLGFLPYQGSLKINGTELNQCNLSEWRKQVSWVGQNPLLLHGSIRENITLGKNTISDTLLSEVIDDSYSAEFIRQHGLDYQVSDRSGGLSVGQAQRLALARAMLQQGHFWLLDEPTASLDARSEKLVMQGIKNNIQGKTTLMVTHQLEHLRTVDHILVMQAGTITESGTYSELASSAGLFAEMLKVRSQNNRGDLDA